MFLAGNITWVRQTSLLLYEHVIMQGVVFRTLRWASLPGGGGTPLYGLYSRYVRPQRVWFFSRFGHKKGIDYSHFAAIVVIKRVPIFAL